MHPNREFLTNMPSCISMLRTCSVVLSVIWISLAAGLEVQAQNIGPATDYVQWQAHAEPTSAAVGETVSVVLQATIGPGWKMYAIDSPPPSRGVKVVFEDSLVGLIPKGEIQQIDPKRGYDPNFKKDVSYFENRAEVWGDFTVAEEAAPGSHAVGGTIHFMICNDRLCLPPTRVSFTTSVEVEGAAEVVDEATVVPPQPEPSEPAHLEGADTSRVAPLFSTNELLSPSDSAAATAPDATGAEAEEAAAASALSTASDDFGTARSGGLWAFLLLAMGAGLAALLTPCVFPMIPLTVSYFTKHSEDRSEAMRMALVYGLAIIVTFTGLGVLMAVLVGAAGAQSFAANPWVNLFIGVVFVIFALSLLGLFELRLPSGLLNYFNRQSNERSGYLGVLFMGLTLTLVSFSCTAPFVGGLLAATTAGSWSYPILGMVVFSATFSLPFIFFALFPRALSSLPKSGSWMNVVKVVLGFIELAAAIKFLSNADLVWGWGLISRTLAIAVTVVIFFLAGLYLLGKLPLKHEPVAAHIGVGRLLFAIAFFGMALYMLPGLLGAPLNKLDAYLPPRQARDVSLLSLMGNASNAVENEEAWVVDDIDAAFAQARVEGKPVMIDFTGYTCTNCREMEANVFTRPEIAERFQRHFVLLRLYTDGLEKGEDFQRYQLKLTGTVALPTYAIVHPEAQDKPLLKISGTVPTEQFAAFLDQGASSFLEESIAAK